MKTSSQTDFDFSPDTWTVLADSYTYVPSNQIVSGWITDTSTSPWAVKYYSWTVEEYSRLVAEEYRRQLINKSLDQDQEIYMVWPDTSPPVPWIGKCRNSNGVAITCP